MPDRPCAEEAGVSLRGAGHGVRPAPPARRPIAAGSASAVPPHRRRTRARQDPAARPPSHGGERHRLTPPPSCPARAGAARPARRNPSPRPPCSRRQRVPLLLRRLRLTLVPTPELRIPPHHASKESYGTPTPPRPFRSARAPPGRPASSLRRRSQSLPAALFAANRNSTAGRGGSANQEAGRGAVARQAGGRDQAVARGRSSGGGRAVTAGEPCRCRPHPTPILPASLLYPARSPPPGPW